MPHSSLFAPMPWAVVNAVFTADPTAEDSGEPFEVDQDWLTISDRISRLADMEYVKVQYAKTHLSALLASVESGEEITISRGDRPVARLVPVEAAAVRDLGFVAYRVPDGFFDDLPEEELTAWEGGE